MNKDDDSKFSPLGGAVVEDCGRNDDARGGEERAANGGKKDDFADATHSNYGSSKRSGQTQSDIRHLQKEVFDLSRENEMLKEILERIQRESVSKRGKRSSCGGDDAKIEEVMKDLQKFKQKIKQKIMGK